MSYKIIHGYDAEDYIQIDDNELEKAFYCFLMKKDGVYSGGAVRGSQIMAIQPDYHRVMGWNRGYKLGAEDYEDLDRHGMRRLHERKLQLAREKVNYLIETKQEHLIGKNFEMPKLKKGDDIDTSGLADKMRLR